jgi:hypothetical protein
MKYAAVVTLIVFAFALNFAGASWVGLVHHKVTSTDSAGFASPSKEGWTVEIDGVDVSFATRGR